jgi:RHS repeat-associated protein
VYDADDLVETVNSTGSVVARYTQEQSLDQPLAMQRGSTTDYYEADGVRSISSLTSSNGSVVQSYTYDSFGNLTNSSGSLTNFFRYTGREFDTETGLQFSRARYYDPQSGRFLSEDLIFDSGGPNLYVYVGNDPTNLSDPLGLWPQPIGPIRCFVCEQFGMGAGDMWNNYERMKQRNYIGDDHYYHCMANCQATNEGTGGHAAAVVISLLRTGWSRFIKREDDWPEDQRANECGQQGGDCNKICAPFVPPHSPGKPPFPGW